MHPTLTIFGSTLRSADVMIHTAVVLCVAVGPMLAARLEGLDPRRVRRALLVLAVVTLAGGRLHFLLNHGDVYAMHPLAAMKLWRGGFHVGGGLIAFALAAPWVTRRCGVPLGAFADAVVPVLGLGLAVARVGCFLQGCCFGGPCDHAWCLRFPAAADVFLRHLDLGLVTRSDAYTLAVHPLQLYFVASSLLVAVVTLAARPLRRYPGEMALLGLLLFAATTAGLEPLRDTMMLVYWGPLTQLTWTAIAIGAVALVALASGRRAAAGAA